MSIQNFRVRCLALVAGALAAMPMGVARAETASVSFQNGANGYTGTYDRYIDERGAENELDGSTVPDTFLDGYASGSSPDAQGLIRFDNIFGNGAGQIPTGAFILDAELTLTTSPRGNAQTGGPWGVAKLLQPFSGSTSYFTDFPSSSELGGRGAWWQDGYSDRPVGGYGTQVPAGTSSAGIRDIVQSWADGDANNGLVVQSGFPGTADGWAINTTGYPLAQGRPELSVTYTTDPVTVSTFQNGANGYSSDTMAWVQSGTIALASTTNPDPSIDDTTTNGLDLDQAFLDGPQFSDTIGTLSSADDMALIKFGDVFGAGAGQAPTDTPVAKAWLVLTTGDQSTAAPSSGDWGVHTMLRDWDTTSLHSNFGDNPGLQVLDGDITAAIDTQSGIVFGSQIWLDVTEYLEGVRNGADDYGVAIKSQGTADGWQINFNGAFDAALRPQLIVASSNANINEGGLAGDFNADGQVDAADYTVWRDNLGSTADLGGNGEETGASAGVVDSADFALWKANFGASADDGGVLGAAVPEPATNLLIVIALAVAASYGARQRRLIALAG